MAKLKRTYQEERAELLRETQGHCAYCGKPLAPDSQWHRDHRIPRCQGGRGGRNFVPACARCNLRKGADTPDEFREHLVRRVRKRLDYHIKPDLEELLPILEAHAREQALEAYRVLMEAMQPENVVFYIERATNAE